MEFRGPGGTKRRRERGQCSRRGCGRGLGGATLAEPRCTRGSDKLPWSSVGRNWRSSVVPEGPCAAASGASVPGGDVGEA